MIITVIIIIWGFKYIEFKVIATIANRKEGKWS